MGTVSSWRRAAALIIVLMTAAPGCYLRHEPVADCDAGTICNMCVQGSCSHDTGEGCGEGEGCYVVAADPLTGALTTGCVPTRSRPVGSACTTGSDCESGLSCMLGPGFTPPGFCIPLCCGGSGCPPDMECVPTRVVVPEADAGPGAWIPVVGSCIWPPQPCDALRQTGCSDGQGCYLTPAPTCMAQGALGPGSDCRRVADCAPGLSCVAQGDGAAICRKLCVGHGDCPRGEACDRSAMLWRPGAGICR